MAVDRFRAAAQYGRRVVDALGMRPTDVAVRLETYSADIADGVTPTSTVDTPLTPRPKVVKLSADKSSWFGGNPAGLARGEALLSTYEIGPITPTCSAGGVSLAQLLTPGAMSIRRRALFVLTGPDQMGGSEVCAIVHADATRPLRIMLTVQRAPQTASG